MNIEIVCVGKLKEKYLKQGIAEYQKRLDAYCKIKIIEVADEAAQENLSESEAQMVLEKEAGRILSKITPDRKVIVMAIEGNLVTSEQLAKKIDDYGTYGNSKLTFIIGGSLGLSDEIKKQADWSISFGRITLPHQLMRLILVEQIYRAFRINHGHAYHK
ncbi:MAG: 23S rRNA (pseudouridine(1915)-N(3))-methyltransferase RlmH [Atopococcus tabaci]|uniref:Ribosomal RNA large subunit methyltransferase H n=1 Tax=Atopococcus tabaci TaxID=269774 RepID=A0AA43ZTF2_9LACT|nr:23S rRNA (pseudouridine(1915)-N(3))-methyltransferase RlmH [Atopococcus tabaci]